MKKAGETAKRVEESEWGLAETREGDRCWVWGDAIGECLEVLY